MTPQLIKRLARMERNLVTLRNNWDRAVVKEALVHKNEIVKLNTDNQLSKKGVDSDGVQLAKKNPYKASTKAIKRRKGQPTDRVTLKDTGKFHRSFRVNKKGDKLVIGATDNKAAGLEKKYGKAIFGLTTPSKKLLVQSIRPQLVETIKKTILK